MASLLVRAAEGLQNGDPNALKIQAQVLGIMLHDQRQRLSISERRLQNEERESGFGVPPPDPQDIIRRMAEDNVRRQKELGDNTPRAVD